MATNKNKDQLRSKGHIGSRLYNIMTASNHKDLSDLNDTYRNGYKNKRGIDAFKLLRGCGGGCAKTLRSLLVTFGWISNDE